MSRSVLAVILVLAPSIVMGKQADELDAISNDHPGRPLQMPPASSEVKEAFEDFDRFSRRNAWERAFKSLEGIPKDQEARFVDGEDGFIVRVASRRRALLADLPPEGRAAYRLFYDAEAETLLAEAAGNSEQEALERLFGAFFLSSVGDDAADRLGDVYFEQGRFDRAAECWLAVLREYPDSDLDPGPIAVKAVVALQRAGRHSERDELLSEINDRYADELITVAGRSVPAREYLQGAITGSTPEDLSTQSAEAEPEAEPGLPILGESDGPRWLVRFGDSIAAGMTPEERERWESNAFSAVVPPLAVDDGAVFANLLGHVFAVDLQSGKLRWRSASFHNMEVALSQDQARMIDPSRFSIVAGDGFVWTVERDLRDQNYRAPYQVVCRRADLGDVVWRSVDLPDYAGFDLLGPPLLVGDRMFLVVKAEGTDPSRQRAPSQSVVAIRPRDGAILWQAEVGTLRQDQRYSYYYGAMNQDPIPRLIHRAGAILVDSHAGVFARLDADTGELDWGFAYETEPAETSGRFFYRQVPTPRTDSGAPVEVGGAIVVKGAKSDRIAAIDPDRRVRLWDRPIAKSSRLIGAVGNAVILGGPEVDALEVGSRGLFWSIRLPGESRSGRPIIRDEGLWHLTPRGIFEQDPKTGRIRRIVRGEDTGSVSGDLILTDQMLIAVTNRTIAAYDRSAGVGDEPGGLEGGESDE